MHDSLKVKDINDYRIFRTGRIANPLDPKYKVRGENIGYHYGNIAIL